jgi:small-conductance mechanosensitive channel
MEILDFSPLKETFDQLLMKLLLIGLVVTVSYLVPYLLLKVIKIPEKFSHSVSALIALYVLYAVFRYGLIPGLL